MKRAIALAVAVWLGGIVATGGLQIPGAVAGHGDVEALGAQAGHGDIEALGGGA